MGDPPASFPGVADCGHAAGGAARAWKISHYTEITPIILDFDLTHQRLTIVDNGFHVYLEGTPQESALSYLGVFPNETT